jgi:ubiquinone/menaquinone biosynthesis C-methylase UbiE
MGSEFSDVDTSDRPAAQVDYLDRVSMQGAVQAYKQRSFEALHLRPGARVLDVGCGTGADLCALADLVGPAGQVVGVDASQTMLAEARARTRSTVVECRLGDAQALDLADGTFDACRADRVLQHLDDPGAALAEMVRVCRPGGRVVVFEPDWDTLVVTAHDPALTRQIVAFHSDSVRRGKIGRDLWGLFHTNALEEITVDPVVGALTDLATADALFHLSAAARGAAGAGLVAAAAAEFWIDDLSQADARGQFFAALTGFLVAGRKSGRPARDPG